MKGIGVEYTGKVLISVFIIGIIFISIQTFLPAFAVDSACVNRQSENVFDLIRDATENSDTIREFVVEDCMEFVDFSPIKCSGDSTRGEDRFARTSPINHRCYEMVVIGQASGNCKDAGVTCLTKTSQKTVDGETVIVEELVDPDCTPDNVCELHKGTVNSIPGGFDLYEININSGDLRLEPGSHLVRIGKYRINFLDDQ